MDFVIGHDLWYYIRNVIILREEPVIITQNYELIINSVFISSTMIAFFVVL